MFIYKTSYAYNAIRDRFSWQIDGKFNWPKMKLRRNDKYAYIELWKMKSLGLKHGSQPVVPVLSTQGSLSAATEVSGNPDMSNYDLVVAISKLRRAPIEALYQPDLGPFAVNVMPVVYTEASRTLAYYPLSADLSKLLVDLEEKLSFEDIKEYRGIAERDLYLDGFSAKSLVGGLTSWLFGSGPPAPITAEQRRALYAGLLEPCEVTISNVEVEKPRKLAAVSYDIGHMTLSLVLSAPVQRESSSAIEAPQLTPFLEMDLISIHVDLTVLGGGGVGEQTSTVVSIQDFEAFEILPCEDSSRDSRTDFDVVPGMGRQYIKLLSRKGKELVRREALKRHAQELQASITSDDKHFNFPSTSGTRKSRQERQKKAMDTYESEILPPLVHICIEKDSTKRQVDKVDIVVVKINVEEMELFISPTQRCYQLLTTFPPIAWPEEHMFWSEMEAATMNEMNNLQYVLKDKLEYMLRNHVDVDVTAEIKAPVLIITETYLMSTPSTSREVEREAVDGLSPYSESFLSPLKNSAQNSECGYLIIDLGHLSIRTERLAKAAYLSRKQRENSVADNSVYSGTVFESPPTASSTTVYDKREKIVPEEINTPLINRFGHNSSLPIWS